MSPARTPTRHPRALYLLIATEMWERLSYYGMQALLVLYVSDDQRGGLRLPEERALQIFAAYTFAVYLLPIAGGFLADRYLGQRRAVLFGSAGMIAGHFLMAVPGIPAFAMALVLLVLGSGLFKPNISSLLGALYEDKDPRRESAFTLFYMGINLGALLAPLVVGTLGERISWHVGFASAGVGMAISLVTYATLAPRWLGDLGARPVVSSAQKRPPLSREEWHRFIVLGTLTFFAIFFWAAFQQAGGLINLFTQKNVDRSVLGWTVPTSWFQSAEPAFVLLLGPLFATLWLRLVRLPGGGPSTPVKVAAGLFAMGLALVPLLFAARSAQTGLASIGWILGYHFISTVGELSLSPVALSAVTRMAPPSRVSLMMGVWFVSIGAGSGAGNYLSAFARKIGIFTFYAEALGVLVVASVALLALSPWLVRWSHGADSFKAA